jgi:hypothetical protein
MDESHESRLHDVQAAPMARSRAAALRALKLSLCAETYLSTALAMSARHVALARMPAVSAKSAIKALST